MPTEAQPIKATSTLSGTTLIHVVGAHTGSGFINMAREILQTQLEQKCKIKATVQNQDLGISRNTDTAYKLEHIRAQVSVLSCHRCVETHHGEGKAGLRPRMRFGAPGLTPRETPRLAHDHNLRPQGHTNSEGRKFTTRIVQELNMNS